MRETEALEPPAKAQANISTLSVSIRCLNISGKQMTLSVFRQLQSVNIIDPNSGRLLGDPWGFVNYFWDGCGEDGEHLHAVWVRGGELIRSCVCRPDREELPAALDQELSLLCKAWLYDHVARGGKVDMVMKVPGVPGDRPKVGPFGMDPRHFDIVMALKGSKETIVQQNLPSRKEIGVIAGSMRHNVKASPALIEAACELEKPGISVHWHKLVPSVRAEADAALRNAGCVPSDLVSRLNVLRCAFDEVNRKWDESYDACEAAGQLFIAV